MHGLLTRPVRLLVLLVALTIGISVVRIAHATTSTVCAIGCDFSSVQAAIDHASSGDTVQVEAGTYSEAITIGKPLTLTGDPAGERPTVQLPAGDAGVLQIAANDVTIQHLHLVKNDQASDTGIVTIPRGGSWPSFTIAYGNIALRDLLVEKGRRGAYITGRDVTVENSTFEGQLRDTLFFNAASGTTRILGNSFAGDPAASKKAIIFENFSSGDPATSGTIDVERNVTSGKNNFLLYDQWVDPSQTVSLVAKGNRLAGLGGSAIVVFDPRPFDPTFPAASFAKIASVEVHANDFSGVASPAQAVSTVPEVAVDATNNWWGCNAGPGSAGCAAASGGVTTSPNLVLTVAAGSSSLTTGQTTTVTAGLTRASNGTDTSSQGVVPDGRLVSFSASGGGLSATSAALTSGTAAVSLTSTAAGAVSVTASLDGASASTTVVFSAPTTSPPAPSPTAAPVVDAPVTVAATPGASGSATVAVSAPAPATGGTAPPITVAVAWTAEAFDVPATVTVTPVPPSLTTATAPVVTGSQGGAGPSGVGFALGPTVVQLSVTASSGAAVTSFAAPLQIHISADGAGDVPAYSRDGVSWTSIPQLDSPELPAGQPDGYWVNPDGSIDIYTRHATYFGLLRDVQAPAAPTSIRGRVDGGKVFLSWVASTDNSGKIDGYELLLGSIVIARLGGSASAVATTVKNPAKPSRYTVRAIDSSGNASASSSPLSVAPQPRPRAAPRTVPAWAWQLLAWQRRPAASRGPRPEAAPSELPPWYSLWAAWRDQPFRIVS